MNLSSVPPCSKITSTISLKYSVSRWAMASGDMRSAIALKPRMSANSTVIARRSPPGRIGVFWRTISAATFGAKYRSKFERTSASRRTCSA
jgi:hypothetical protein